MLWIQRSRYLAPETKHCAADSTMRWFKWAARSTRSSRQFWTLCAWTNGLDLCLCLSVCALTVWALVGDRWQNIRSNYSDGLNKIPFRINFQECIVGVCPSKIWWFHNKKMQKKLSSNRLECKSQFTMNCEYGNDRFERTERTERK